MADLHQVTHDYTLPDGRRKVVLDGINLELRQGGFHVILGRSGCGKSTLLRLIAGLETPRSGRINLTDEKIGVVFQEPRLMPWLSVEENVGFLIRGRVSIGEQAKRVAAMLELVGLSEMARAIPKHLSGGMAQRVAIARALVCEPSLLLMDEPFGALDAFTRKQIQDDLIHLWQRSGKTVVFVTHDIEEAVRLAQSIFVLEKGRFVQQFSLDADYPRKGAEPEVNIARQKLLDQFFTPSPDLAK